MTNGYVRVTKILGVEFFSFLSSNLEKGWSGQRCMAAARLDGHVDTGSSPAPDGEALDGGYDRPT